MINETKSIHYRGMAHSKQYPKNAEDVTYTDKRVKKDFPTPNMVDESFEGTQMQKEIDVCSLGVQKINVFQVYVAAYTVHNYKKN
jgi:hypothetical protein